jgi:hypothetical protein
VIGQMILCTPCMLRKLLVFKIIIMYVIFLEILGDNFFSHLLKWGQLRYSHQDLNHGGELSSQWTYHCTMSPFAI